jgi:hypothetical protein
MESSTATPQDAPTCVCEEFLGGQGVDFLDHIAEGRVDTVNSFLDEVRRHAEANAASVGEAYRAVAFDALLRTL